MVNSRNVVMNLTKMFWHLIHSFPLTLKFIFTNLNFYLYAYEYYTIIVKM